MYRLIACFVFLTMNSFALAQSQIATGLIIDSEGLPLIGAALQSTEGQQVTTDVDGRYSLPYADANASVEISYIGHETVQLKISQLMEQPRYVLPTEDLLLETMTITSSRYQKRLSETAISMEVLQPRLVAATNAVAIDEALDKVSGVQMIGGQANIRGGSGFSYGAGSRVMLLIDDMPALQVDAGYTNWNDIPTESISQVEIVKGASSSLYGSSALNGVINVRTAPPTSEPSTKVSLGYENYLGSDSTHWWKDADTTLYRSNISIRHSRTIGPVGVVASLFTTKDRSFNQNTYQNRNRATLQLRYTPKDRLTLRLNTLYNHGDNGDFFLFDKALRNPYAALAGGYNTQQNDRLYVDPSLTYFAENGDAHRLRLRYHYIDNRNSNNQSNGSSTYYGEYQYGTERLVDGLQVTTGMMASHTNTSAALFGDTTFTTQVMAAYVQGDYQVTDAWSLSAGLRYEYNRQQTPEVIGSLMIPDGVISDGRPVARLASHYAFGEYSSLRASIGQGYRFPTVTERFISTQFGGFSILPNPDLVRELGYTAELGYKQGIRVLGFEGFADIAVFTSAYEDMIEFAFDLTALSFKAANVGDTRIFGTELSLFGQVAVGKSSLNLFGGYTYIDPKYRNFDESETLRANLSSGQNVLKYRSKHTYKMDAEWHHQTGLSLGVSVIGASHLVNIDGVLEGIEVFGQNLDIVELKAYREIHDAGYTRWDARLSYQWRQFKATALVKNLLDRTLMIRPGRLEAPKTIGLRLDYEF